MSKNPLYVFGPIMIGFLVITGTEAMLHKMAGLQTKLFAGVYAGEIWAYAIPFLTVSAFLVVAQFVKKATPHNLKNILTLGVGSVLAFFFLGFIDFLEGQEHSSLFNLGPNIGVGLMFFAAIGGSIAGWRSK